MIALYINKNGELNELEVSRGELAEKYSLNTRDLRPIFSIFQVVTILPRQNAVIINLGFIKLLLLNDEAYIFSHKKSGTYNKFINKLKNKIKDSDFKTNFFLNILELTLGAKLNQMQEKVGDLTTQIEQALSGVRSTASEKNLKELLVAQKRVSSLEIRLKEILSAIEELIDDEENFDELANVISKDKSDSLELESILENFLEQIEEEIGKITRLKDEIEDTQDYLNLKLSSSRTAIVRFDLIATITTLVMSLLAVIVGLFGVNIRNGFEESQTAFLALSLILILIFFVLSSILFIYLKRKEIL